MSQHPRKAQVAWWVADALADRTPMRTLICVGGIGAAKSYGSQCWDLARCIENGVPTSVPKPSRSWTVAPNYRIAETLFELTLEVAMDKFGLEEGHHFRIQRSFPRTLDFSPMGLNHQLAFLSAANPETFVSASLTHWRWSEVGVSKEAVFKKVHDRLRDRRGKVLQALFDGSPEGTANHFFDLAGFIGEKRDVTDSARNIRVFRVETRDNAKHLAPGYIEAQEARYAYNPALRESYLRGIFTSFSTSNSAYREFVQSRNVIDGTRPSPYLPIVLSWDFNVSPLAWVVCQEIATQRAYYLPRENRIVALAESAGDARGLMDAVADFAHQFPVATYRDTPICVYGDASGWARSIHNAAGSDYRAIEEYLAKLGYRNVSVYATKANPLVKHRLEKTAALMAYERFVVDTRCQRLIQSFVKTTLKPGTFEIEKPSGEDHTHYADAVTYALFQLAKDIDVTSPTHRRAYGAAF